jgi:hypothetical protein
MPIDALAAEHFSLGLPAEVNLVGLAVGVRPELLWQPFDPEGAMQVRFAVGIAAGPELLFVPVDLGLRVRWFPQQRVHLLTGAGWELQTIHAARIDSVVRSAFYMELGLEVEVTESWSVGGMAEVDFAPPPVFGFGAAARLGVTREF